MPLFGAHLSIAGGHHNALLEAQALGCDTVQLFTRSPSQWSSKPIEDEQVRLFRATLRKSGLRIPIGHGDGNYFADKNTLDELEGEGRVAFYYATQEGEIAPEANPNGSQRNIAGVFNKKRTVLGMMPHPERLSDPKLGGTDGRRVFEALAEALG